ncbi:MAG TPA: hypothetical protein VLC07_06840 [Solirubrobacterales bacterium]|nr:hypothetical protein [Solirubrobacterales bacterium]
MATKRVLPVGLAVLVLAAGCGANEEGAGPAAGSNGDSAGCLSPAQVSEEVNRIAEGAETSSEEVEAKRDEIAAVEAEAC